MLVSADRAHEGITHLVDCQNEIMVEGDSALESEKGDGERQEKDTVLKMLALADELGVNVSFPPELLKELRRAEKWRRHR